MSSAKRELRVKHSKSISAEITVPGDNSISHRALILAALSNGPCKISGFLPSKDCLATLKALRALGVQIDELETNKNGDPITVLVHGTRGHFTEPTGPVDCGNSGTTMRLLAGILAAQPFTTRLIGDASLSRSPMGRIIEPLEEMGAEITAEGKDGCAPLLIKGRELRPIDFEMEVASAQVKSCVLLAGLLTKGRTTVIQPGPSRDHTERMLEYFMVKTLKTGNRISAYGGQMLESRDFHVPGDISSAAFWMVAAAAQPDARLTIRNVGLNPTRAGILQVLVRMGARISDTVVECSSGEPHGHVTIRGGKLKGIDIKGELIPNIIDELPIIAIAAALAEGTTTIRGAEELRVKETDRIQAVADNLQLMGVNVQQFYDGMEIEGGKPLTGARIPSYDDHRIAMSFAIAGLFAEGETIIEDVDCVSANYPGFEQQLKMFVSSKISGGLRMPTISSVFSKNEFREREKELREERKRQKEEQKTEKETLKAERRQERDFDDDLA